MLERLFRLRENGTSVRTEVLGGVTTFMTMAYIIFVNPALLSQTGMDFGAVMVATCLSAGIATWIMGLAANYPIAMAPGMGENFFFRQRGRRHGSLVAGRAGRGLRFRCGLLPADLPARAPS